MNLGWSVAAVTHRLRQKRRPARCRPSLYGDQLLLTESSLGGVGTVQEAELDSLRKPRDTEKAMTAQLTVPAIPAQVTNT